MNVLVFTTLYPNNVWPNLGVFIKERMTNFARLDGCRVAVVAPVPYVPAIKLGERSRFAQVAAREVRDGLDVYHPRYFMTPKIGMSLYGVMIFLSVLPAVRRLRHELDFDLIDAHFVYPDGMAAVLLGRALGKPVVVSARGSDINQYARWPVIRRLLRFTLDRADGVIAVSNALKRAIVDLGIPESTVAVVPNGVDGKRFHRVPRAEARRTLGLPAGAEVIVSVGSLIPRKGFDLLLGAFKTLCDAAPGRDRRLVIIGDGPSRRALEKHIASLGLTGRVRLAGAVRHDDLARWYSAADVSCLASSREGWPNVVLESLACGTPVVAAPIWGVPEIIRSDRVGLLVERDPQSLADGLGRALGRQWEADELIRYAGQHTWDVVARRLHDIFHGILTRRPRSAAGDPIDLSARGRG